MGSTLDGRTAIITGSGRGIGRAAAMLFAAEGAEVVVATRSAEPGQETVQAIRSAGGRATLAVTDIGSRPAVEKLVAETVRRHGGLHIVLHNAAYIPHAALEDLSEDDLDRSIAVNLKAAFWFAACAVEHLERSKAGRLLFTSSLAGNRRSYQNLVHYGATKAGLNGFIRGAALELAPRGITVNGVEPGMTLTHSARERSSEKALAARGRAVPIGRAAQPIDIARPLLFLASDAAAYITGETIVADGGLALGSPPPLNLDRLG